MSKMDVFSLEEDDCEGLFITQSGSNNPGNSYGSALVSDIRDFSSPCASLVNQVRGENVVYSDISDEDDFQLPSSQVQREIKG